MQKESKHAHVFSIHKSNKRTLQIKIGEPKMKRILRRQKSGYALSLILCFIGVTALFMPLWKTWPKTSSSQHPLSTFWALLWTEQLDFIPGVEFKLAYLTILGAVTLIFGVVIWSLSRQWFSPAGQTVLFQCPFCKKQWRASPDKGLVRCPHCHQLVHPKMIEE
jgi:hypothetical protein